MRKKAVTLKEFSHIPRQVGAMVQRRIDALGVGQKMQDLPEELWHPSFRYYVKEDPDRKGGPNLRLIRLDPDKPSLTVTGYIFNKFVHPYENRYITPREAARLQGFPDDFLFQGSLTSTQRQVGNAVPVQLAQAAGNAVLEHIAEHHPLGLGEGVYTDGIFPVLSLFSGAGGMDLGFLGAKKHGMSFDIRTCIEYDHDCCETLRGNFGHDVAVIENDISHIDPYSTVVAAGAERQGIPIIIGGPPCQAFSQAGKQQGLNDPRGQLISQYLRFVRDIQPTYFVMENVANLRGVANGALFREIKTKIDRMGYNFSCNLLCAADYGSPQLRRRLVFIGVRKPYPAVQAPMPTHGNVSSDLKIHNPYTSVGDAFAGLPSLKKTDMHYDSFQLSLSLKEKVHSRAKYRTKAGL